MLLNSLDPRSYASVPALIAFAVLGAALIKWHLKKTTRRRFTQEHGCRQPKSQIKANWPLGLDLLVKAFRHAQEKQLLKWACEIVGEAGLTCEQNVLGVRGIDTIEPENVEAILTTNFSDYNLGIRPPTLSPLFGNGIFTQTGAPWKRSRDLLRPLFHSKRSGNFEEIQAATERLVERVPLGTSIDLQPLFFRLTLDTTTFLISGKSLNSLGSDKGEVESDFAEAFSISQDYLAKRDRLAGLYWLIDGKDFRRNCRICHEFVDGFVKEALSADEKQIQNQDPKHEPFLATLMRQTRDPIVLRDQSMNIMLAGRDTTACTLSWACRLLATHPSIQQKLRQEIASQLGLGTAARYPDKADLKKLTYLNNVLKETLRLYPAVPANGRAATKDTVLPRGGGPEGKDPILVRKGEPVVFVAYVMHRRKDLYGDDAESFRPERWEDGDSSLDLRNIGYGYVPFNAGPRTCLGQEFALQEAGYVLVRLLQTFGHMKPSQDLPPIGEEKQTLTLVLSSADGCWITMEDQQD